MAQLALRRPKPVSCDDPYIDASGAHSDSSFFAEICKHNYHISRRSGSSVYLDRTELESPGIRFPAWLSVLLEDSLLSGI